jgi:hypothetical protein
MPGVWNSSIISTRWVEVMWIRLCLSLLVDWHHFPLWSCQAVVLTLLSSNSATTTSREGCLFLSFTWMISRLHSLTRRFNPGTLLFNVTMLVECLMHGWTLSSFCKIYYQIVSCLFHVFGWSSVNGGFLCFVGDCHYNVLFVLLLYQISIHVRRWNYAVKF